MSLSVKSSFDVVSCDDAYVMIDPLLSSSLLSESEISFFPDLKNLTMGIFSFDFVLTFFYAWNAMPRNGVGSESPLVLAATQLDLCRYWYRRAISQSRPSRGQVCN